MNIRSSRSSSSSSSSSSSNISISSSNSGSSRSSSSSSSRSVCMCSHVRVHARVHDVRILCTLTHRHPEISAYLLLGFPDCSLVYFLAFSTATCFFGILR